MTNFEGKTAALEIAEVKDEIVDQISPILQDLEKAALFAYQKRSGSVTAEELEKAWKALDALDIHSWVGVIKGMVEDCLEEESEEDAA